MSNETFKNVKNVNEQFSELSVSGNFVVYESLFAKDIVAASVVHAPLGKTLKEETLNCILNGKTAVEVKWTHPALSIVAAELSGNNVDGLISVGKSKASEELFEEASLPARVSNLYSQPLGTKGSPTDVEVGLNGSLYVDSNIDSDTDKAVALKVYYYELKIQ